MSDELPDEEQLFKEFGEKFRNSTPEPADGYWSKIDESIQRSAHRSSADTVAQIVDDGHSDSQADTNAEVIRLKPMDKTRFDWNRTLPAVAASLLLIAATVGVLQFLGAKENKGDQVSTRTLDTEPEELIADTPTTQEPDEQDTTVPSEQSDEPDPVVGLEPGLYCYLLDSEVGATGGLELIVTPGQPVTVSQSVDSGGRLDPANVSSFVGDGTFVGDSELSVVGEFWVEGGIEAQQIDGDIWDVSSEKVTIGEQTTTFVDGPPTYSRADCVELPNSEFPSRVDPLDGLIVRVDEPIRFVPGGSSGSVSGAVIRGERDVYRVEVEADQVMSVSITSLEDNAVFDLVSPLGLVLNGEATEVNGVETAPGVYLIIVGGTRGNATYDMTVSVN